MAATIQTSRRDCAAMGQKTDMFWRPKRPNLTEGQNQTKKPNHFLVGVAGFEPATPASRTQCSTGLSHTPTRRRLIALGFADRKKPIEGFNSL